MEQHEGPEQARKVDISNFRPNIVVTGASAHEEDEWESLSCSRKPDTLSEISGDCIDLRITGPCARCCVINVDGTTGIMDGRALNSLATYRRKGASIYFGQFAQIEQATALRIASNEPIFLTAGSIISAKVRNAQP